MAGKVCTTRHLAGGSAIGLSGWQMQGINR